MKSKLLLLMCLVGALCFSCDDDNDFVDLIAEKLSVSSARVGDQLVITGKGFSTIKDENIVKLNDLTIPVEEATSSELKVIIPEDASTGDVTVRVDHQEVNFGEIKILKERLFMLKSNYSNKYESIIEMNPKTGEEKVFMELPYEEELMYSSLAYLGNSNKILLVLSPEEAMKKYSIISIDIETKKMIKTQFESDIEIEWVALFTDHESNTYVRKNWNYYDNAIEKTIKKSKVFNYNIETGDEQEIASLDGKIIFRNEVNTYSNKIILTAGQDWSENCTIMVLDPKTKEITEIPTKESEFGDVLIKDEKNIFVVDNKERKKAKVLQVNLETGASEVFMELPEGKYYSYGFYLQSSNEIGFLREGDSDTVDKIIRINANNKEINMTNVYVSFDDWYHDTACLFI